MVINISHLEGLHNLHKQRFLMNKGMSRLPSTMKMVTNYSNTDEIKVPYLVSGVLVKAGTIHDNKLGNYHVTADALNKAHQSWVGKKIYKCHDAYWKFKQHPNTVSIDNVVGKIISTTFNSVDETIEYVAEIYDSNIATKIWGRLIEFVSAGFLSDLQYDEAGELFKVNIEGKEMSLVEDPKIKAATITPAVAG